MSGSESASTDAALTNLFTPEHAACPQPDYREIRRCPVAHHPLGSKIIARYEDVMWALRHPEIFSNEMDVQMALGTERPMIPQQIDPPRQTAYRKLLDPLFSRKRMAVIEPSVREQARALVDAIAKDGECEFDHAFAIPLPCGAFLSLLGLPLEELDLFLELKDGIIRPQTLVEKPNDFEEIVALRKRTGRRIYEYFEKLIDERKAHPRDDLMSFLVSAQMDGRDLERNEILDISFLLLLAGLDTVTATLGCNIAYLASNPEQRRKLVGDPSLIPSAVEELLRWETPVTGVPRLVKQDVTVAGVDIKKGEMVNLLLGAADTDPDAFPEAEQVDFERRENRHIAFGGGAHRCLGSHLARMELKVGLEEWHRGIPDYRIKPGETPRYSPGIREVQYLPLVWEPSA